VFSGVVWQSSSQYADPSERRGIITTIRKMKWMAPQAPNEKACLFVLIGIAFVWFLVSALY
jgi:hypothetical protein